MARIWRKFGEFLAINWRIIFFFLPDDIVMNYPYYNFQPFQQKQELIRVNGLEGAKNYPLSPGSTIALFDAESDIMYIKTMDAGGFPSIRTFSFMEMTSKPTDTTETRLSAIEEEIANIKEALNGFKSIPKQKQQS